MQEPAQVMRPSSAVKKLNDRKKKHASQTEWFSMWPLFLHFLFALLCDPENVFDSSFVIIIVLVSACMYTAFFLLLGFFTTLSKQKEEELVKSP